MKFPLRVVSVERSLFEGDVEFIIATGAEGELGVLARHAPLMTILKPGPLRIQETYGGPEQTLFVGGGFLEVLPERVTVLADVAEHARRRRGSPPRPGAARRHSHGCGRDRVPECPCHGGSQAAPGAGAARLETFG